MLKKKQTNKQTNKQNKHRKVIQKILSPAVWGKKNLTQTKSPISRSPLPPSSTPQKSNGRPLFSQNSESCASFQTRRTTRLVEKNNNNNLRGNLDLQGQCVCKQKKVPLFTKSLL